jgi:hypothetical protein
MKTPATIGLIGALLSVLCGLAPGQVLMRGVLSTGSYRVEIDSVNVRTDTLSATYPTAGWGEDTMHLDTFDFPVISKWPSALKLFYVVNDSHGIFSLPSPVQDSWYKLPGWPPTEPKVMFYQQSPVQEPGPWPARPLRLSVTPSVAPEAVLIKAGLSPGRGFRVEFYDAVGNRVRTLAGTASATGTALLRWPGGDDTGRRLPEGVYYCSLAQSGASAVCKLILPR